MRTTIWLDARVHAAVVSHAAVTGRSFDQAVADALRRAFGPERHARAGSVQPLPTFGGSGVLPGIDLISNASLRDTMDGVGPTG